MYQSAVQSEPATVVPPEIAPSEDLTARAREAPESVEFVLCGEPQYAALFDRIARVLHRREQGNVLLVGERGVGIGAMLGELARWGSQIPNHKEQITNKFQVPNSNEENGELSAVSGQLSAGSGDGSVDSRPRPGLRGQALRGNDGGGAGSGDPRRSYPAPPFLRAKRFIEVNCRYTVAEESRVRLLGLLASVARHEELVVCIDGFGSLDRGGGYGDVPARSAISASSSRFSFGRISS
jgi:hypothetical protein